MQMNLGLGKGLIILLIIGVLFGFGVRSCFRSSKIMHTFTHFKD